MSRAERRARAAHRRMEVQEGMLQVMRLAVRDVPHGADEIWGLTLQAAEIYLDDLCRRNPQEAALIRAAGREQADKLFAGIRAWVKEVSEGLDRMDREAQAAAT